MYEPHYEEETGGGGFLIGLLCGTALGAAIGLMFAPKAGSEIPPALVRIDRRYPAESGRDLRPGQRAGEQHGHARDARPWIAGARRSRVRGSRPRARPRAATERPRISAAPRRVPVFPTSIPARARLAAPSRGRPEQRARSGEQAREPHRRTLFALLPIRSLQHPCQPLYGIGRAISAWVCVDQCQK